MLEIHTDPRTNVHRARGTPEAETVLADLAEWQREWDSDGIGYWAVILPTTDETIGFGGLRDTSEDGVPVLNLYYRFRREHWGNGYATELARAAVDWARDARPDQSVVINTRPNNDAAQRIAAKLGFEWHSEREYDGAPTRIYLLRAQESTIVT